MFFTVNDSFKNMKQIHLLKRLTLTYANRIGSNIVSIISRRWESCRSKWVTRKHNRWIKKVCNAEELSSWVEMTSIKSMFSLIKTVWNTSSCLVSTYFAAIYFGFHTHHLICGLVRLVCWLSNAEHVLCKRMYVQLLDLDQVSFTSEVAHTGESPFECEVWGYRCK